MRRQGILIIVFAALFALSLVLYFAVISPMTRVEDEPEQVPETEAGESLGTSNRFFMFGSVERSEIKTITVDNEYGGFTFEADGSGGFHIKGYDSVNYDQELFATLVNISTYTLSKAKLGSNLSDEKLQEYGLLEPQASWTVNTVSGDSYTVYVGDRLLTGGGYYCQLEGRRSVYVLGIDVENTVLVPVEDYVTPVLCAGLSQDDYYLTENFTVYQYGEMLFSLRLVDAEDMLNPNALAEVIMDYPTEYYPNTSVYYQLIYDYMNLVGDGCVKLGATEEDLAAAGLTEPAHRITFEYNGTEYELRFSEKDEEEGIYYATSSLYPNVIAYCYEDSFEYLEYGLIDWIDEYLFQQNITNIAKMTVKSDTVEAQYDLSHSFDDEGDAVIAVQANGKDLSEAQATNFRQYYKSFLAIAIQDYYLEDEYCTMTEEEMEEYIADRDNAYMFFTYTTLAGEETEMGFYRYSTRHSIVTVNGVGEFYILTDLVKKIENDTVKILNGETVVAYDKN